MSSPEAASTTFDLRPMSMRLYCSVNLTSRGNMSSKTSFQLAKLRTADSFSCRFATCQRRTLLAESFSILTFYLRSSMSTASSPRLRPMVTFSRTLKLRFSQFVLNSISIVTTFLPYFLELNTLIVNGRSSSVLLVYLQRITSSRVWVERPSFSSWGFLLWIVFFLFHAYLSSSG